MKKEIEEKLIRAVDILIEQNFRLEAKIAKLEGEILSIKEEFGLEKNNEGLFRIS